MKLKFIQLKILRICVSCSPFICIDAFARGGYGSNAGFSFLWLIGVAIAFMFCKAIGERLMPDSESSAQAIVGFLAIAFGIAILIRILN
jgi:hypothetical protein